MDGCARAGVNPPVCKRKSFLGLAGAHRLLSTHDVHLEITAGGRNGLRHVGAMMRFGYLRDPLFLAAAFGYALNRWLLKSVSPSPFLHGHFNDLLLIPAGLPLVLWVQRRAGWRTHDRSPSWGEMLLHLVVWSVICECIGPHWLHHGTSDLWDVVAYASGGVAACLWWHRTTRTLMRTP